MEDNTSLHEKLDLLEKQIDELKKEKDTPLKCKIFWTPVICISLGLLMFIIVGCGLWVGCTIDESANMSFWIIKCITLVVIVAIVSILTHKVISLISPIEQRKSDSIMSIYKEREMLVINLRKSLANKVLDSITLEDKKDGGTEKDKKDESKHTILKEQCEHK